MARDGALAIIKNVKNDFVFRSIHRVICLCVFMIFIISQEIEQSKYSFYANGKIFFDRQFF
jgi:hypothetical protein